MRVQRGSEAETDSSSDEADTDYGSSDEADTDHETERPLFGSWPRHHEAMSDLERGYETMSTDELHRAGRGPGPWYKIQFFRRKNGGGQGPQAAQREKVNRLRGN